MVKIIPTPVSIQEGNGVYIVPMHAEMKLGQGLGCGCTEEFVSLWNRFACRIGEIVPVRDGNLAPFEAVLGEGAEVSLSEGDEYALAVSEAGVRVVAESEKGLLHGLYTLLQMIHPVGEERACGFDLPVSVIHDRPQLGMRALHLCLFPENTLVLMEKAIRLAAITKYTHVIVEFWGTLRYDSLPELGWPEYSWSKQEIRRLVDIARNMGMEVIPMFNHLGHATQARGCYGKHVVLDQKPEYATLFEPDGWTWCLSNPATHRLLRSIREELMELCGPGEYFHLGCDEAFSYASCPLCSKKDGPGMLAEYLNGLTEELAACGRRPMIWADGMLDSTAWESPTVALSYPELKTHLALDLLDKRIIMADWQYYIDKPEVPSAEYFLNKGFETVLCPFEGKSNIEALGSAADTLGAMGMMVTTWHRLPEMFEDLEAGAGAGWHGAQFKKEFRTFDTSKLVRNVMPELPRYEDAGFKQYEVLQLDRWLMK